MKEETKQITFEGNIYTVPTWVKWVARDEDESVWGYAEKPFYSELSRQWGSMKGDNYELVLKPESSASLTEV